jgi:diaminohydroxyphosphoribosylaminopyrimidine deaminase/5-amino-6-(5-phosphoribosylamino)uracil reductase
VVAQKAAVEGNVRHFERIKKRGADVVVHEGTGAASNLRVLLDELARRGVQQVLVEGGPTVLASFLSEGLGDEVCVYISPKILGAGGGAYLSELLADPMQTIELHHVGVKSLAEDVCLTGLLTDLASQPARRQDEPS